MACARRRGLVVETGLGRAKCITSRCWRATARKRSTRIWRSKRSGSCTSRSSRSTPKQSQKRFVKAICKGPVQSDVQDGASRRTSRTAARADLRGRRPARRRSSTSTFTGTASNIEGIGLFEVARGSRAAATGLAFGDDPPLSQRALDAGGEYAYRIRGEEHMWDAGLDRQAAARGRARTAHSTYREYAALINEQSRSLKTLRGLFRVSARPDGAPVPPRRSRAGEGHRQAASRRGAMSLGSISTEAHTTPRRRDEPHRRQVETPAKAARIPLRYPRRVARRARARSRTATRSPACWAATASKSTLPLKGRRQACARRSSRVASAPLSA